MIGSRASWRRVRNVVASVIADTQLWYTGQSSAVREKFAATYHIRHLHHLKHRRNRHYHHNQPA